MLNNGEGTTNNTTITNNKKKLAVKVQIFVANEVVYYLPSIKDDV